MPGVHLVRGDELGRLDGAAVLAIADVDDHHAHAALRRVGDAVADPEVVDAGVRVAVLAHVLGLGDVTHVDDDVLGATRDREEIVVGGEDVVHAAGQFLVEGRRDLGMRRYGEVEDHDAVHAVGRALAREHAVASVGRDRHVVDRAGVDLHRVGLDDVIHVGDVEHEGPAVAAPGAHEHVVPAVLAGPRPEVGGMGGVDVAAARDLDALPHVARIHLHRPLCVGAARLREQRVAARVVRGEPVVLHDARPARQSGRRDRVVGDVGVAPGDRRVGDDGAVRPARGRLEMDHITGAHLRFGDPDLEARDRVRGDRECLRGALPFGLHAEGQ